MNSDLVITGGSGFLGWHVRVLAHARQGTEPISVPRAVMADPDRLAGVINGADRVVHLAGANRGSPDEVTTGIMAPARNLAVALQRSTTPPKVVVFANSVQAGNGTPYGNAKADAAGLLADAAQWCGSEFVDLQLPNLFGEHGLPHYNSAVATFCHQLAGGDVPRITHDREVTLLHATDAARLLLDAGASDATPAQETTTVTVSWLADRLQSYAATYRSGVIPELENRFDVRLFNTYRSHYFPRHHPMDLPQRTDNRGNLCEAVKALGSGQVFCSSTRPGITRGEHYHLTKVERFVVLSGDADISLRRLFTGEVIRLRLAGTYPVAVDIPTMWAHNITNVGSTDLLTLFWTNELFDPEQPDTYPEPVG